MGESSRTGGFSIAMVDYQKVVRYVAMFFP